MKLLVYCQNEAMLGGFKFGHARAIDKTPVYTQGVDARGYWLLIEDDTPDDNMTCELTQDNGLLFTDTEVEV